MKNWRSHNPLLLKSDKTEMLVIGAARHWHHFDQENGNSWQLCDLSKFDRQESWCCVWSYPLFWSAQSKDHKGTPFFHLCSRAKIQTFLSMADAETLIHGFVSSRLDNWNVLLSGQQFKIQQLENFTILYQFYLPFIGSLSMSEQTLRSYWWFTKL